MLAVVSGVPEAAIRSFVLGIGRPLLLAEDAVQFRDEPVETWFRERFKPQQDGMREFVRTLIPLAVGSAYVAATLPQLMLEAGQFTGLVELALNSAALPETSTLEKRDVEVRRAQFAFKASLRSRRYVEAAKLALKAGEQTAGDGRRRGLIQANTDVAALFVEPDRIQEIVSAPDVRLRVARVPSRLRSWPLVRSTRIRRRRAQSTSDGGRVAEQLESAGC